MAQTWNDELINRIESLAATIQIGRDKLQAVEVSVSFSKTAAYKLADLLSRNREFASSFHGNVGLAMNFLDNEIPMIVRSAIGVRPDDVTPLARNLTAGEALALRPQMSSLFRELPYSYQYSHPIGFAEIKPGFALDPVDLGDKITLEFKALDATYGSLCIRGNLQGYVSDFLPSIVERRVLQVIGLLKCGGFVDVNFECIRDSGFVADAIDEDVQYSVHHYRTGRQVRGAICALETLDRLEVVDDTAKRDAEYECLRNVELPEKFRGLLLKTLRETPENQRDDKFWQLVDGVSYLGWREPASRRYTTIELATIVDRTKPLWARMKSFLPRMPERPASQVIPLRNENAGVRGYLEGVFDDASAKPEVCRAAEWYVKSGLQREADHEAVFLATAFEVLLGDRKDANKDATYRLSQRLSWSLGSNARERAQIEEKFQRFYNLRSDVVHGREKQMADSSIDIVREMRDLLERVIVKLVQER
jgi:hypothetical protein